MNKELMDKFLSGEIVINTKTKEELIGLVLFLNDKTDLVWGSGKELISLNEIFKGSDMCVNVDGGKLRTSTYKYFLEKGIDIISPEQLFHMELFSSKEQLNKNTTKGFEKILIEMLTTYLEKNHMYGDSFGKSVEKYGMISALTRISDKFNRLEQMILNENDGTDDERLRDTLLDMASYCVMTIIELENE